MTGLRIAVVGATGAVGREIIKTLYERAFPVSEIVALASGRSVGQPISFGDKQILKVQALDPFDFAGWDLALFSPGAAVSAVHAPRAAAAGCMVIDNTSQFRMEPDVPLVVPEVNAHALARYTKRGIIAQSQLQHDPDGAGAEAVARPLWVQARCGVDVSIGVGRGQGGDGRAVSQQQGDLRQ